jgi:hypothetical protein
MATIADLFSFAETIRCKLLIAGGLALSMVSGLVFPGSYEFGFVCFAILSFFFDRAFDFSFLIPCPRRSVAHRSHGVLLCRRL